MHKKLIFIPLALAVLFAIFVIGGSIGGGNMFQANQTVEAITSTFNLESSANLGIGIIMLISVGTVIVGGIKPTRERKKAAGKSKLLL